MNIRNRHNLSFYKIVYGVFSIYGLFIINISSEKISLTDFSYHLISYLGIYLLLENKTDNLIRISNFSIRLFISIFILIIYGFISYLTKFNIYIFTPFVIVNSFFIIFLKNKAFRQITDLLLLSSFTFLRSLIFLLFNPIFTKITTLISWLTISSFKFGPIIENNKIFLETTGVNILPGCSGLEQIIFSLTILFIFIRTYPIKKKNELFTITIFTIFIPLTINTFRVSSIALLTSIQSEYKPLLIDFLHENIGSFVFNLFSIIPILYLHFYYYKKSIYKN